MLVVSASGLIRRTLQYRQAADEYAEIEKQMEPQATPETTSTDQSAAAVPVVAATGVFADNSGEQLRQPADTAAPVLYYNDQIRKLKTQNSDTVGYLEIAGTAICYPVVQRDDNEYYETHTFSGKSNPSGAIFMDSANRADLSDFNTVLYGHNMKDGSMFHDLLQYRKASFAGEHDTIVLTGLYAAKTYRIFSAYTCSPSKDMRGFGCVTDRTRQAFINTLLGRSAINPGQTALSAANRIITLITCREDSDRDYFVVHGVLVE